MIGKGTWDHGSPYKRRSLLNEKGNTRLAAFHTLKAHPARAPSPPVIFWWNEVWRVLKQPTTLGAPSEPLLHQAHTTLHELRQRG